MRRVADDWVPRDYARIKIEPYGEVIGAEVRGIDLAAPLDDEIYEEIRHALLEWKVLFFRDQDITSEQQVAFARRFGDLEQHPFLRQGDSQEVVRFEKGDRLDDISRIGTENGWHTDVTWRVEPAMGSILRAVEVPG
jgi:taurine dioxygenase